jgi:hypothetical protein
LLLRKEVQMSDIRIDGLNPNPQRDVEKATATGKMSAGERRDR